MKALLITYDLQPPWDSGLKVYGRGLMNSLNNIKDMELDIISTANDISNLQNDNYSYVHVVLTGVTPFAKALRAFKRARIFKHIVTPSIGFRNALSTKLCYGVVNGVESRLIRCFSSEFVASSYFMNGTLVIPPSIDEELFINSERVPSKDIIDLLESSQVKSGLDNIAADHSDGLLFYSGPLTEDRFPHKKVLHALKQTKSKILIIGRPTNNGADAERVEDIISYSRKLEIEKSVTVALRLLNEEEKTKLLNYSDVVIQPFAKSTQLYVAVDPPIFLLEAMACGKPVVTSKSYSFQSLIVNGQNGYTIDWDNPEELSNALEGCYRNSNISVNARKTIMRDFSRDSVSKKLERMYDDYN